MTTTTTTRPSRAVALLECPVCGDDWDPRCPRATGQAWDPTIGIRSEDVEERVKAGGGKQARPGSR